MFCVCFYVSYLYCYLKEERSHALRYPSVDAVYRSELTTSIELVNPETPLRWATTDRDVFSDHILMVWSEDDVNKRVSWTNMDSTGFSCGLKVRPENMSIDGEIVAISYCFINKERNATYKKEDEQAIDSGSSSSPSPESSSCSISF